MSLFNIKDYVKRQILYRKLFRLFALVSKTALESYASSKATFQKELGIVAERAYTNWHCTCYARILNFSVHPDHQQHGLNVEKLLLKWFIQAAEQEGVPMYATTTSSLWHWDGWICAWIREQKRSTWMMSLRLLFTGRGMRRTRRSYRSPRRMERRELNLWYGKHPKIRNITGMIKGGRPGLRCI